VLLNCLEQMVGLDIFKADWSWRRHLLDPVDDGAWDINNFSSDLLDAAIWIEEVELVQRLFHEETEDETVPGDKKLTVRLLVAAQTGNMEMLRIIQSRILARTGAVGLSRRNTTALLARACKSQNASLLQHALDAHDPDDPWTSESTVGLDMIARYAPSADAYRRLEKILTAAHGGEQDPFFTYMNCVLRHSHAAAYGHLDLLRYFIEGKAGRRFVEELKMDRERLVGDPLAPAVCGGSVAVVRYLLDSGADPNTDSSLSRAIRRGYKEIARLLVDRGADVNTGYPPPIAMAVLQEDMQMFRYLLRKGAVLREAGVSSIHAGGYAMNVVRVFGLDSMAAELIRAGVAEDLRLHWVPDYDEWALHPVRQIEYGPYLKPSRISTSLDYVHLLFDQAHCLSIGEVTRRRADMRFDTSTP